MTSTDISSDSDRDPTELADKRLIHDEEYRSSLSLLYGKPGVPEEDEVKKLMSMTTTQTTHPVRVIRDHYLDYPDLGLDVFIAGDKYEEAAFAPLFSRARCQRAKSVLEADLVVFTGGPDVDPQLYGEKCHVSTNFDTKRDSDDMALYVMCHEHGIPMVGVCRGAQFLNVMNGGKLYQDVDGHYGDHSMYDLDGKTQLYQVSSVHHQLVFPNTLGGMHIIAVASGKSIKRIGPGPLQQETCKSPDIEAFFYRDTCSFGVQGHPEYSGYPAYSKWFLEKINELVIANTDVVWDSTCKPARRRLDPTIIAERDGKLVRLANQEKGAA